MKAKPFKLTNDNIEIKKAIEQNNYTNQCLKTIGKQLDKIEVKIDNNPLKLILQGHQTKMKVHLLKLSNKVK